MNLIRIVISILFMSFIMVQSAFCADNFRVKDIILDNSDRMIFIQGQGNFKNNLKTVEVPIPNSSSVHLLNDITAFTITSPPRYVIDIPNAILDGGGRTYKMQNSKVIQSVQLAQFSANPNVVRAVFTLNNNSYLPKIKAFTSGNNIVVQYAPNIIDNSIQYKFYTPQGDKSKGMYLQDTSAIVSYSGSDKKEAKIPTFKTKYFLSQISQNTDGLILRGVGSISYQRAYYSPDNTEVSFMLDNASTTPKVDGKSYKIPNSDRDLVGALTLNIVNSRKIKLTINAPNVRDFRFVISPDGQSLFISHRSFIINTLFSEHPAAIKSYKITNNDNGYKIFDLFFDKSVTYDVFEYNNNFYLDVNNLGDYNIPLFENTVKESGIDIQALKISQDKTRFIIPTNELNFAYANVESNSKSIKLCFKKKVTPVEAKPTIPDGSIVIIDNPHDKKNENINVIYVPKDSVPKIKAPQKPREIPKVSSMKKVVIDPGHGGADSGAIGGGVQEKNLNLEVAHLVMEKLKKKDVYVYMTRDEDKTLTLEERVNYSNELNPDIFVSIHTNSTFNEESYGLETHYYKEDSYSLAQTIHNHFASDRNLRKWDTKDRGVLKSRFYVINHTEAPSVLIEIGFISNLDERVKLIRKGRQEEIASSIVAGILEYLKRK